MSLFNLTIRIYHKITILILFLFFKVASKNSIKSMLKHITNINTNICGVTPLIWAASYCEKDIVEILLSQGADTNLQADDGTSALMCAATKGNKDIVELLLNHGADANLQADDGVTALMCAATQGNEDIVEILLSQGADANIKDNEGSTVMAYTTNTAIINHIEEAKNSNLLKRRRIVTNTKQTQHNKTNIKHNDIGGNTSSIKKTKRRLEL